VNTTGNSSAISHDRQHGLFGAAGWGTSIIGLSVVLPCECRCGSVQATIGSTAGFDGAALICTKCNCHAGRLPSRSLAFITKVSDLFGRPSEPIVIRSPNSGRLDPKPAATAADNLRGEAASVIRATAMTNHLQADRDAVESLVNSLFPYANPENFISLRAFHDLNDGRPPLFVEGVQLGDPLLLDRVCTRITETANRDKPHVFCPPLCTFRTPNGGKLEDLAEGICLTVDCDENPQAALAKLTALLGPPTCVVASGGVWTNPTTGEQEDKLHLHWRLSEPASDKETFDQLREARKLAADHVGADKTAASIVHPLRWAGSWHRKDPTQPRLVRIETNPDAEIELSFALERLRELNPGPRSNGGNEGHTCNEQLHAPLPDIKAALTALPNYDLDWESWNRMGMAAWAASSGEASEAFDKWSQKSSKYDAATTEARWKHYAKSPPDRIGAGTIFYEADKLVPGWRKSLNDVGIGRDEFTKLAALSRVEYDRCRKETAQRLGITLATLDSEVASLRLQKQQDDAIPPHWQVESWEEPINCETLLKALVSRLQRHVVMTSEQALTTALWVMMSWLHDRVAVHSPILMVTSAEANSGKSTLLGVLEFLVPRGLSCVSLNEATLFRSVDLWKPSLICDEADTLFVDNEPLRAVFNSGWTRGAGVLRCVGEEHIPKLFLTFCPKIVGLKGRKLPDTTLSRAIIIELRRKKPDETAQDFEHIDDEDLAILRRQLSRWAGDNAESLAGATPDMPPGFHNRVRANWKLLFAIADLAGDNWPPEARAAASKMVGAIDATSIGIELLTAIKAEFDATGADCITSKNLVERLTGDPEGRWSEFRNGRPITQKQLAGLLKQYTIISSTVHPTGEPDAKGYKRTQFEDAWERYL
jgi:hypothetical protein